MIPAIGAKTTGVSNTTVTSNTNSVGAKSGNVILIGGLDDKPGYLSITQQVEKLKSGMTSGKTVTGFRYVNSELPNALDAIAKNPDAYVVLFSAGCQHSVKVSSAMKDKKKLFIVEGFVESSNVKNIIQTAVDNLLVKGGVISPLFLPQQFPTVNTQRYAQKKVV